MDDITLKQYGQDDAMVWDKFIFEKAVNATFLQSRRFLNYHPEGRFIDKSYIFYEGKGNIVALCPAAVVKDNNEKCFISHPGSTFGGLIFDRKHYNAENIIEVINVLENQLVSEHFSCIDVRITPEIFSKKSPAVLEYCLYYKGYNVLDELNTYIDYAKYNKNILNELSNGKRGHIRNCLKAGLVLKELSDSYELENFYNILCTSLKKYNTLPVHTLDELIEFKNYRLKDECGFFGVCEDNGRGKMVAGGMMFYFTNINVAHTQYLAALPEYSKLSPMSFLYYSIIKEMRDRGFDKISFGISTENKGKTLNIGLTNSKEAYGGEHCVNRTYVKKLE